MDAVRIQLEGTALSERSQLQQHTWKMVLFISGTLNSPSSQGKSRRLFIRRWGVGGEWEAFLSKYGISVWKEEPCSRERWRWQRPSTVNAFKTTDALLRWWRWHVLFHDYFTMLIQIVFRGQWFSNQDTERYGIIYLFGQVYKIK